MVLTKKEPDRDTVKEVLQKAFPNDWQVVITTMRWNSIEENWTVNYFGMLVGIECDGYVHS